MIKPIVPEAEIIDNRVFVPLRLVSENMGFNVSWAPDSKLITVGNRFTHRLGTSRVNLTGGGTRDIGVNSYIKDDRTMVSIRLFSEAPGYKVEWRDYDKVVLITTK